MSETSVLAQEYRTAANLSQTLNRAVVALKKACLARSGAARPNAAELESGRQRLADVVETVLDVLAPREGARRPTGEGDVVVPGAFILELRADHRGDLDYFAEDLERAAAHLRAGMDAVTNEDLARLDELAAAADAEAGRVFRRLMRT